MGPHLWVLDSITDFSLHLFGVHLDEVMSDLRSLNRQCRLLDVLTYRDGNYPFSSRSHDDEASPRHTIDEGFDLVLELDHLDQPCRSDSSAIDL